MCGWNTGSRPAWNWRRTCAGASTLKLCRVTPSLPETADPVPSLAPTAAAEMERILRQPEPLIIALGTGRTLRATVEALQQMAAEQHRIVSLIGNIAPDGSASYYDVIIRIADKVRAPHFPMPIPVIAETRAEPRPVPGAETGRAGRSRWRSRADVAFVGVGQMTAIGAAAEGRVRHAAANWPTCRRRGAAGEIAGRAYDSDGRYLKDGINARVCGVRGRRRPRSAGDRHRRRTRQAGGHCCGAERPPHQRLDHRRAHGAGASGLTGAAPRHGPVDRMPRMGEHMPTL